MVFVQESFGIFRITRDIDDSLTIESNYEDFEESSMISLDENDATRLKTFLDENF